jgi:outer membrane lipopolysaccharide assembly protein LptE/RlpB
VQKFTVLLCLILSGCGYRLASKNFNGGKGQTIAVPAFTNQTTTYRIEQRLAEAVRRELIRRTNYTVVTGDTGDAVMSGEVLGYSAVPVIFDPQGRGKAYSLLVDLKVRIVETKGGKVLFQNDRFTFRDVFELSQNSGEFVPEDSAALDRLSQRFASSLVAAIIHSKQ